MKKIGLIFVSILLFFYLCNLIFTKRYIVENLEVTNCRDCLVNKEKTAVNIAEAIVFEVYGESMIKDERPYHIDLINDRTWIISGSLKKNIIEKIITLLFKIPKYGGSFEIKIDAKDGKVIEVLHYK